MAEPGYILCSTDFSFIELCAFAQNCYDRYKDKPDMKDVEGSVMRKVINAGLDPHRWFSGVMHKVITPDLSKADDPEWIAYTKAFLKERISAEQRQSAKMANFGLPGGLCEESFYRHCREGGLNITLADAKFMRDSWINTFREMTHHMAEQEPMRVPVTAKMQLGLIGHTAAAAQIQPTGDLICDYDDEDDDEQEGRDALSGRKMYMARNVMGMRRANASLNSAENFTFQSLVACGAKLAGWNLLNAGYGDRLRNFVHVH